MNEHDQQRLKAYEKQLDIISEALTALHPFGDGKAVGNLECVAVFREWLDISGREGYPTERWKKALEILGKEIT